MSKYAFAAAAALSALIASSAAMADKTLTALSDTFTVSVTVNKGCTVTTQVGDVLFGSAAGNGSAPQSITRTPKITCTSGTEYDASLVSTGGFKMKNAGTTSTIAYVVESGSTTLSYSTTEAGAANKVTNTSTDGSAQDLPLKFSIPAAAWTTANKAGLTYSDTVTLKIEY